MLVEKRKLRTSRLGFTLIEILVVVAIIALLSAIALVALQSARQKSRDAKRLSDMTQMATAMELFFNTNKGYPASLNDLVPNFTSSLPSNPLPADGGCDLVSYPLGGGTGAAYEFYPSPTGGSYVENGMTLYPDYIYYFCLGKLTGNWPPGMHYVTPKGLR